MSSADYVKVYLKIGESNMKKILLVPLIIISVFSFITCSNGTTTGLVDKSNIWLIVNAYPNTSVSDGTSTPYTVYCQLQDQSAVDGMGDFSGVTITINGQTFSDTSDSNYWNTYFDGIDISLAKSDTLTVYISHPTFGSVEATGIVPPSLSSFVDPGLPAHGEENTSALYVLNWNAISGDDEYSPGYSAYSDANGASSLIGRGYYTSGTSYSLNVSDVDGVPYKYLELSVSTIDVTLFSDFASSSALKIEGTNIPEFTNLNL